MGTINIRDWLKLQQEESESVCECVCVGGGGHIRQMGRMITVLDRLFLDLRYLSIHYGPLRTVLADESSSYVCNSSSY